MRGAEGLYSQQKIHQLQRRRQVGLKRKIKESLKIIKRDMNKLMKDLPPYKALGPDAISSFVLEECAQTLHTPLRCCCKYQLDEGLLPREGKRRCRTYL